MQIGWQVSVFMLGYGSEHDGDYLNSLAAASNGLRTSVTALASAQRGSTGTVEMEHVDVQCMAC